MNRDDLPHLIVGACMTVHGALGPGLIQEAYLESLALELRHLEIDIKKQVPLDITFRGNTIASAATLDLVVGNQIIVQVYSSPEIAPIERQKMESFLRLSGLRTGLLVNFHVGTLRKGIERFDLKRKEAS